MDQTQQPPLARRSSFQAHQDILASDAGHPNSGSADAPNSSQWKDSNEPLIKGTDMPEQMQSHAIACTHKARAAAKEEGAKKDLHNLMAKFIKKDFDATYGGVWHCVVGRNFGSLVTHTSKTFIYFYLGQLAVLLFKSGSQAL